MLLILLLLQITVGCKTVPKSKTILPPMPQREIMPKVTSTKDFAKLVNYYEHLVQEWENWGDKVTLIVKESNDE